MLNPWLIGYLFASVLSRSIKDRRKNKSEVVPIFDAKQKEELKNKAFWYSNIAVELKNSPRWQISEEAYLAMSDKEKELRKERFQNELRAEWEKRPFKKSG